MQQYIWNSLTTKLQRVRVMVFNATFNNISVISWQSGFLLEETGIPGENHRPVASHWQTLWHKVALITPHHEQNSNSQPYYIANNNKYMYIVLL
jgi:hypothetical protein